MWQLQLKGFAIKLRDFRLTSASKAPGVTQLILFEYKERLSNFTNPWNNLLFTSRIRFSDRILVWNKENEIIKFICLKNCKIEALLLFIYSYVTYISKMLLAPSNAPSSIISIRFRLKSTLSSWGSRLNKPRAGTRVILLSFKRSRFAVFGRSRGNSFKSRCAQSTVPPSQ